MSIDLSRPFRGSAAVAAGLLTWGELRGLRFQKLFPDVYAPARLTPTLARLRLAHPGAWRAKYLAAVVRHATCLAESPMETRIRMALWAAGLPPPVVQFAVPACGKKRRLDLAYPEVKLAIEYDGEDHRTQERARLDLEREAALVALGWTILRFDAYLVHRRPDLVARAVAVELRRRGLLVP